MSYILKEQPAASKNHGGPRSGEQIRYLVIHYTGNDGDSAAANAAYFQNNVVKASAHYFVDDDAVYRSVPDLQIAWAVGGKKYASADQTGGGSMHGIVTNANSISIELCDTTKNGTLQASETTLSNAAELCRELMARYNIPIENVYRHFDVTGKACPAYFVAEAAWKTFLRRLDVRMDSIPAPYAQDAVAWAVENGILLGDKSGNLNLSAPCTRQQMAVFLHRFAAYMGNG